MQRELTRPLIRTLLSVEGPTVAARGTLSFNGNVLEGETVTIGIITYTFSANPIGLYGVLIGVTASVTNLNLIGAINTSHPDVGAAEAPGKCLVTAKILGTAGNAIATTSTSLTATWGAPTLEGGA